MSLTDQILDKLKSKHVESGGHNGLRLLCFGIELKALKKELNTLHKQGIISVREGKNEKLIFYKEQ